MRDISTTKDPLRTVDYGDAVLPEKEAQKLYLFYKQIAKEMEDATGRKNTAGICPLNPPSECLVWITSTLPDNREVISRKAVNTGWEVKYDWVKK